MRRLFCFVMGVALMVPGLWLLWVQVNAIVNFEGHLIPKVLMVGVLLTGGGSLLAGEAVLQAFGFIK